MAGKKKQNSISINQYKTKRELNIGTVIFALVFIYLVVAVVAYATDKKINIYEVREGSILRDNSYTGLILREESVVTAENDGYINYYQSGQSKVKTGMNLCAISPKKLELGDTAQKEGTLSQEDRDDVVREAQNFNENFVPQKFTSVYSLKREVEEILQNASDQTRTAQLDAIDRRERTDSKGISCIQRRNYGIELMTEMKGLPERIFQQTISIKVNIQAQIWKIICRFKREIPYINW